MGLDYPEVPGVAFDVNMGAGSSVGAADESGSRARENYRIRLLEARKYVSCVSCGFSPYFETALNCALNRYCICLVSYCHNRKSDQEILDLTRNVDRIRTELSNLQQAAIVDQRHQAAVTSNLERKVEESIAVSANSVNSVIERSSRLEDVVRQAELAMRTTITDTKGEVRYILCCSFNYRAS